MSTSLIKSDDRPTGDALSLPAVDDEASRARMGESVISIPQKGKKVRSDQAASCASRDVRPILLILP